MLAGRGVRAHHPLLRSLRGVTVRDMAFQCDLEGISAVIVGNFNPAIFQPAWLARNNLIRESEATNAEIELVRPELASFTVGSFIFNVHSSRLKIETLDPGKSEPVRDLIVGIFSLLEHTPVSHFGINRNMHFRAGKGQVERLMSRLRPVGLDQCLDDPKVVSATALTARPGSSAQALRFKVEPSVQVPGGIYIDSNEHYEAPSDISDAMNILRDEWRDALQYSRTSAERILSTFVGEADG